MHVNLMKDSDGDFQQEQPTDRPCLLCRKYDVVCEVWESSDGGFVDEKFTCKSCDHVWWVDGIDS